jgi:hypothetical protein
MKRQIKLFEIFQDCIGEQINGYQKLSNMQICHQEETQLLEINQNERLPLNIR